MRSHNLLLWCTPPYIFHVWQPVSEISSLSTVPAWQLSSHSSRWMLITYHARCYAKKIIHWYTAWHRSSDIESYNQAGNQANRWGYFSDVIVFSLASYWIANKSFRSDKVSLLESRAPSEALQNENTWPSALRNAPLILHTHINAYFKQSKTEW